jgi:beta-N-acetylhexosaminidase
MGAITQNYGLEDAALLALGAGVDVLLVSENTVRRDARTAARVVTAIQRALDEGRLTRATVQAALKRVETLRTRIPPR